MYIYIPTSAVHTVGNGTYTYNAAQTWCTSVGSGGPATIVNGSRTTTLTPDFVMMKATPIVVQHQSSDVGLLEHSNDDPKHSARDSDKRYSRDCIAAQCDSTNVTEYAFIDTSSFLRGSKGRLGRRHTRRGCSSCCCSGRLVVPPAAIAGSRCTSTTGVVRWQS